MNSSGKLEDDPVIFPIRNKCLAAILLLLLVWAGAPAIAFAQEDMTKFAREEQNPISTMTQIGLRYFAYSGAGADGDQNPKLLTLHLTLPYKWNEDWNLIALADMPFTSWQYGSQNYSGAGNLLTQFYFSPRRNNKSLIWGVGPAIQFPTANNKSLDNGQSAAGPTFALVRQQGRWVNALQGYQLWKTGGRDDSPAMNLSAVHLGINYNLTNGWALGLSTGIISDWTITNGEKNLVPVGMTIGRTIMSRRGRPLSWNIGTTFNVVRPTGAPKLQYKFQLTYLFPLRTVDSPNRSDKQADKK